MSLAPKEITPLAAFSYQQVKLFKIYSPVPFIRAAVSRKEWTPVLPQQQSFFILCQPELQFTHCLKNISSSVMWGQFLSLHSALTLRRWWSFLANFRSILFYGRQSALSSSIPHRLYHYQDTPLSIHFTNQDKENKNCIDYVFFNGFVINLHHWQSFLCYIREDFCSMLIMNQICQ